MTNRKSHMSFRLTPRSMTLDDLELYKFEFSENFSGFRRFRTQQQLNEWRYTSIVSDNVKHVELEQFLACFRVARVCHLAVQEWYVDELELYRFQSETRGRTSLQTLTVVTPREYKWSFRNYSWHRTLYRPIFIDFGQLICLRQYAWNLTSEK